MNRPVAYRNIDKTLSFSETIVTDKPYILLTILKIIRLLLFYGEESS